ncbi:hypothetical protein DAPPUDRAFT_313395 [Daphnia pulex]|uniref:Uncharacterized protein n=1 Tax=Daphnia pulex TaxID=6669 RepID=E9G452_DAPPU|nr:hypothetical protein DAPPUDRAFT_313395 [Daphnia pulex]|eukprot:EFX85692.1 hypothetical protein DAPPUDRAFT_313395 [Daphnia pulex]
MLSTLTRCSLLSTSEAVFEAVGNQVVIYHRCLPNAKHGANFQMQTEVLSYRVLNWHDRLYEKSYVISRKRTGLCSQHDSLFANCWLPALNLPVYFLSGPLDLRVILRYFSWTSSIIAEHRREHAVIQD